MKRPLIAATLLLGPATAWGVCAPEPVLKIVTAAIYPDVPADDFASKPKTLYRRGERFGRLEEQLNPETGLHLLFVVNEPDVWMVNKTTAAGEHIVDPGPVFRFVAPVLGDVESEHWKQFELGCEVAFMEEVGAKRVLLAPNGPVQYRHSHEGVSVELYVTTAGVPIRVEASVRDRKLTIEYLSFEYLDAVPPETFTKPEGVTFAEGG
ncbi:MAG: hypothetical protein AMXMBFR36_21230 [Acidobacteriota bacterium]